MHFKALQGISEKSVRDAEKKPVKQVNISKESETSVPLADEHPAIEEKPVVIRKEPSQRRATSKPAGGNHKTLEEFRRLDLPLDTFYQDPKPVNLKLWNKDLRKFIRDFSELNQENGGGKIYSYNLIELFIEMMVYELKLQPINEDTDMGFQDVQELREYLQKKLEKL